MSLVESTDKLPSPRGSSGERQADDEDDADSNHTETSGLMLDKHVSTAKKGTPAGLSAHEDARDLVRLIQCSTCSRPLRTPVTLPCGNSLCRECLPEAHDRDGTISYPDVPGRRKALQCPFTECGDEHPVSECSVDVTLAKVMEAIAVAVDNFQYADLVTVLEEPLSFNPATTEKSRVHQFPGGRLTATYALAATGGLAYHVDLDYPKDEGQSEQERKADLDMISAIVELTNREVDCQVCYALMLDPVTTYCGHTLCRSCMARVLDYSLDCPVCRRSLSLPAPLTKQPSNRRLCQLLEAVCPEAIVARVESLGTDGPTNEEGINVPLFICTLGFPNQPTFLRIFEPRYRLMLRRCLEGNRQFGMLMYNRYLEPQGELGPVHFYHYGTMLEILHSQTLADGTSVVETRGTYRFRVTAHSTLDGYVIGNVERMEDAPIAEEERIEVEETSRPLPEEADMASELDHMSTQALFELGQQFVGRMQARSAVWLQQRVLDVHGQPPEDAAVFPYWFASVLPISEEEKYRLLGTTTVRERLKITASWIRRIEAQRWTSSPTRV